MATLQDVIDSLDTSATRADTASLQMYGVANGPASGAGSTVVTDSGAVPSIAKFLADNQAKIDDAMAAALEVRLGSLSVATDGAGIPKFNPNLNYAVQSVGAAFTDGVANALWFVTSEAERTNIKNFTSTTNHQALVDGIRALFGDIYLPAGRWNFNAGAFTRDGQRIIGDGCGGPGALTAGHKCTWIRPIALNPGDAVFYSSVAETATLERCALIGVRVTLPAGFTVGRGVNFKSIKYGLLEDVWVNSAEPGGSETLVAFHFEGRVSGPATEGTYCTMRRCYAGLVGNCVTVESGANNLTVEECRFQPLGSRYGVLIDCTTGGFINVVRVLRNAFENVTGTHRGVYVGNNASNIVIACGNRFENVDTGVTVAENAHSVSIEDNYYESCATAGNRLEAGVEEPHLAGNHYSITPSPVLDLGSFKKTRLENGELSVGNFANTDTKALSWVERGTWNPNPIGITSAGAPVGLVVNKARWFRFGQLMMAECDILWTGHSGTGQLAIDGLPFPVLAGGAVACYVVANGITYPGAGTLAGQVLSNQQRVALYIQRDAGGVNNGLLAVSAAMGADTSRQLRLVVMAHV